MYTSFWDKWGLPIAAGVIGIIILWGLFFAPRREDEVVKKTAGGVNYGKSK